MRWGQTPASLGMPFLGRLFSLRRRTLTGNLPPEVADAPNSVDVARCKHAKLMATKHPTSDRLTSNVHVRALLSMGMKQRDLLCSTRSYLRLLLSNAAQQSQLHMEKLTAVGDILFPPVSM